MKSTHRKILLIALISCFSAAISSPVHAQRKSPRKEKKEKVSSVKDKDSNKQKN